MKSEESGCKLLLLSRLIFILFNTDHLQVMIVCNKTDSIVSQIEQVTNESTQLDTKCVRC